VPEVPLSSDAPDLVEEVTAFLQVELDIPAECRFLEL